MPVRESPVEVPPTDRLPVDELFACEDELARSTAPELIFTQPADKASAEQFADETSSTHFLDEPPLTKSPLPAAPVAEQFRPIGEVLIETPRSRDEVRSPRGRNRVLAACAAVAFAAAAFAGWYVGVREKAVRPVQPAAAAAAPAQARQTPATAAPIDPSRTTTPAPAPVTGTQSVTPATDSNGRSPSEVKEVATTLRTPAAAEARRPMTPPVGPAVRDAEPLTAAAAAVPPVTSAAVPERPALAPEVPVAPVLPARDEPIGSAAPVPAPPLAMAPAPAAAPVVVDERAKVRAALARYEVAYSDLDAAAAARVYPGIDQRALARAFGALDSQQILLRDCRIDVQQSRARAVCDGTATWTPKVGGRPQETARRWEFELQQQAAGWQIGNVRIR